MNPDPGKNTAPVAVVLGGSFNPPTLAHKALMEHARKHIGQALLADVSGIYVPSSNAYVSRKILKGPDTENLIFSESDRLAMLEAISDENCSVSTVEYGDDGRGHTYDTMCRLRDADPGCRHIFLLGADKLRILPKWHSIEKFLSEFMFAVTFRGTDSPKKLIARNPLLARHEDSFVFIPDLPKDYASISSTEARAAILNNDWEKVRGLCGESIAKIAAGAAVRRGKDTRHG